MSILGKIKKTLFSNSITKEHELDELIKHTREFCEQSDRNFWEVKLASVPNYATEVVNWDDKRKTALLVYCIAEIGQYGKSYNHDQRERQENTIREAYLNHLLRAKLSLDTENLEAIVRAFIRYKRWEWASVLHWPLGLLLNQLTRQFKDQSVPEEIKPSLTILLKAVKESKNEYGSKERLQFIAKIESLLFEGLAEAKVKPTLFLGHDSFMQYANPTLLALPNETQKLWFAVMDKALKAKGSKPTQKYLSESLSLAKAVGTDNFKKMISDWFTFVINHKETSQEHTYGQGTQRYTYTTWEFLTSINLDHLKGLVWMCANFHDQQTLNLIAKLAERCFKKIPGQGPTAAALGNACLYTLYQSKGLDGIGHLSRLKLRIKQHSTQQLIEKYIAEAAEKQGVSTHEIEDMAVEDFKLQEGKRTYQFDDYNAVLTITGVGKSELQWFKPDGQAQKTVPSFVKEKQAAKLKKVKDTQKQIDQTTSAQRDRIDRMLKSGRQWKYADFKKLYLKHGLLSVIAEQLIWIFSHGHQQTATIKVNGNWLNLQQETFEPHEESLVSLWHPALSTLAETKAWRNLLLTLRIQQPLKQAFREVYLLTDAEVNTRTYSNRMASHVLKQHQFNMLAKTRGWKFQLMGAFDNGVYNDAAQLLLPEYKLRVEYWINEVNADNQMNDTGIWNYISTDQVRFISTATNETLELIHVPPLVFSEVLRDVDLFVGVASVGNDPTWQDSGGVPAYRDYWTSYSFGDLSEMAKNRKEILEGLVPRLKIAKVSSIEDRFLVVKGKLRTYKIHLGSTNILMEPNDQYLCIVPDRSQKSQTENLFIPFEGDNGLSIILSKAFLLANDDQITDKTITSQINIK